MKKKQDEEQDDGWKQHASRVIFPTLLSVKAKATERLRLGIVVTGNVKLGENHD